MEQPRLAKSIRRVILLAHDESGKAAPVVVYERGRKKKQQTRLFRPLEQLVRRTASAQAAFADSYVSRHRDSNAKARDGWIRDLNRNVARATRRGVKKARVFRP